ncbi:hypothetical protein BJP36_42865 [Moorena producens JHB]|uniref:Uncharacterized protein n=1 Tax=Moorena producens (strain JHB) TaxID=1454205 RepID=A0A9Q9ST32_MOOP1|nr:hypothetical protein [Moorena producens]WAN69107.1 hypothetical protein BJP36_42865 [Moorena producens JHB]
MPTQAYGKLMNCSQALPTLHLLPTPDSRLPTPYSLKNWYII